MADALNRTTLTAVERRTVLRFARDLERALGDRLTGVWLFGSRARGEAAYKRSVGDFFQAEVDRDKLVLAGSP